MNLARGPDKKPKTLFMALTIETLGRKKLSVILIAILVVAAAWAGMILASSWKARQHWEAAEKALTENDLDQAQEQLAKYLQARPRDSNALLLAARTARRRGDLQAFEQHLKAYEQIQGPTPAGEFEKQLRQVQEGDLAAEESLKQRTSIDETNAGLILEALGQGNVSAVHLPQAIECLNQVVQKQPSNTLALYWRGQAWESWNQFEKALDDYETALAVRPDFDRARQGYAECLNRIGRVREAVGQYDLLRRRQPDNSGMILSLAGCWEDLHELEKAQELVNGLLAREPENVAALVEKGRIALRKGQFDQAEESLEQALKLAPRSRDAHLVKQLCLESQGKDDLAASHKVQLREIQRDSIHKAALLRQVVRTPHDPAVRYELGMIYLRDHDESQAARWLRTALSEDPKYRPAKDALGTLKENLRWEKHKGSD
jgi:tetratricopeptide (TPR) repeat protein